MKKSITIIVVSLLIGTLFMGISVSVGRSGLPGSIISADTEKPKIINVQSVPNKQFPGGPVNITCNVTDDTSVGEVWVNIANSTGSYNFTMLHGTTDNYYYNATYTVIDAYDYYIWANDTAGNENQSAVQTFKIGHVRNLNTSKDFVTIQDAINDAATSNGQTIYVEMGVYRENLIISKAINLIGEKKGDIIVDANGTDAVLNLTTSNINVSGLTLRNGNNGVAVTASDNTIINCTISNSNSHDIYLGGGKALTVLNSTFNRTKVYFGNSSSILTVQWYLGVDVKDGTSNPISGASIDIYDLKNNLVYSGNANPSGQVNWIPTTEYVEKQTGTTSYTPHTIVSNKQGYYSASTQTYMDMSKEIKIVEELLEPPIAVSLTTGLQYTSSNAQYDILASLTRNGQVLSYSPNTTLTITIYDDAMNKVVENDTMNILDASMGLYNYTNTTIGSGVYFVVVYANISGTYSVGMTSFEVVDWIQDISNINATVTQINANLKVFWSDFNSTWSNWNAKFSAYWSYFNTTIDGLNATLQARMTDLSSQMSLFESNITTLLNNIGGNVSKIDENLTAMNGTMQSYFLTLWNQNNDTQSLFITYWGDWNTTTAQMQADLNYLNLTVTSINWSLTNFKAEFGQFWNYFNSTNHSNMAAINSWFNTTWQVVKNGELNITGILNGQNVNISAIAHNITILNDSMQDRFQTLYNQNSRTHSLVSAYWAEWNVTSANMHGDLDFLNTTLQDMYNDLNSMNATMVNMLNNIIIHLEEVNASLSETLMDLDSDILQRIDEVNASLSSDMYNMMLGISYDLKGLNDTLSAQIREVATSHDLNELREWMQDLMYSNLTDTQNNTVLTLDQLNKLDDALQKLDSLNSDLQMAQSQLSREVEGTGNTGNNNTILLLLLIVLVSVLVIQSFRRRNGGKPTNSLSPLHIEETAEEQGYDIEGNEDDESLTLDLDI